MRLIQDAPDRLELDVRAASPALLVLSEVWDPGWSATVSGVPAPVSVADQLLRAVPIPPGQHTVVLSYDPPLLRVGLVITAATLALFAVAIVLSRRGWFVTRLPDFRDEFMNIDRVSIPDLRTAPISRRSALFETAGIALVLAVTIGAASITAKPIPNPPSHKTLNIMPASRIEAEEQQLEAEKDTASSKAPGAEEAGQGRQFAEEAGQGRQITGSRERAASLSHCGAT